MANEGTSTQKIDRTKLLGEGLPAEAWVFDMFSTLVEVVEPPQHIERMAEYLKRDPDELREAANRVHESYERGLTSIEHQLKRVRELGEALGVKINPNIALELLNIEAEAFIEVTRLHENVLEDFARLRKMGRKIAICSNVTYIGLNVAKHHGLITHSPTDGIADYAAFSCVEGVKKPESDIYLKVCHELGVKPVDSLFFDDNPECVTGAETVGMHGILILSPDGTAFNMEGVRDEFAYIDGIHQVGVLI